MREIQLRRGVCLALMVAVAGVIVVPATARGGAQLLGQVSTARTLDRGTTDIGGYLGVFDHATTVFGQYRRGLRRGLDFGLQAGLVDPDQRGADAGIVIGGDAKFNVMSTETDPFDMALDTRFSYYDINNVSVFSIGETLVMSRGYRLSRGSVLSPYGGVSIRLEHISYSHEMGMTARLSSGVAGASDVRDANDTSLEIGGVGGVLWELSDLIDAIGEVVIDDDWGLVFGLNFKL